jgi:hypothetical protein
MKIRLSLLVPSIILAALASVASANPAVTVLSPDHIATGNPAFTLELDGTGFVSGSVIVWNGTAMPTTYVNSGTLRTMVPASYVAARGYVPLHVKNPDGTVSTPTCYFGVDLVPVINSVVPSSTSAGSPAFTMTVLGANYAPDSVVLWNGTALATTYVCVTQINAVVPAANIASPGSASITVSNPDPGGVSNAVTFTITTNPAPPKAPVLSGISPASAAVGGPAFALTVTGSNFTSGSAVQWNGTALPTTFISASQLKGSVSSSNLSQRGTVSISVLDMTNGVSNSQPFNICLIPVIISLSPASTNSGNPGLTLTVNGKNFAADSIARWNGSNLTTVFISSTQLTAQIGAAGMSRAAAVTIDVVNASPGGTSNTMPFLVGNGTQGVISDLSQVRVFPNPWRADQHGGVLVTFDHLFPGSTIKLFTISARWIKSLQSDNGVATWDLTNDAGEKVASGYYFYVITDSQNDRARGKLAIIR